MNGTKQVAQRIVNANNWFYDVAMGVADITKEQAIHVLNVYIKTKVAKRDLAIGVYKVKHGAFFEKEVILNAVNYAL